VRGRAIGSGVALYTTLILLVHSGGELSTAGDFRFHPAGKRCVQRLELSAIRAERRIFGAIVACAAPR
jgi:hypothetical protein